MCKGLSGAVSRIAMWNRALTLDELLRRDARGLTHLYNFNTTSRQDSLLVIHNEINDQEDDYGFVESTNAPYEPDPIIEDVIVHNTTVGSWRAMDFLITGDIPPAALAASYITHNQRLYRIGGLSVDDPSDGSSFITTDYEISILDLTTWTWSPSVTIPTELRGFFFLMGAVEHDNLFYIFYPTYIGRQLQILVIDPARIEAGLVEHEVDGLIPPAVAGFRYNND